MQCHVSVNPVPAPRVYHAASMGYARKCAIAFALFLIVSGLHKWVVTQ